MVVGSITSQRISTVVSSKNGSMTAVLASGIRIMSDSLMPFHPAMEEPSNILPSWKNSSSTSRAGMVTCCSLPRVSVKRRSAVPVPAAGSGRRAARGRTERGARRILARSLGSESASMKIGRAPRTFQELIFTLQRYWSEAGCVILQPYDMEVGAGTFHTATFLRAVGPEPWRAAYVQPSRRPTDGRYGENPFRLQHYYQYQVVIKPSPLPILDLYLRSLAALGLDPLVHDVRLVEDNWESPTLGAWGLGWEVWLNGMEITQFTYFQQVGGLDCRPVTGEITYGLERLAMYLQGVEGSYA